MVLVYPLSMRFFPLNGFFAGCQTVCLARNARHAPQKVIGTLPARIEPLKGVAQCRTMSHDAQVDTWKEFCQGLFYRYLNFM